jgi:ATP-dependent DNA helicase RecQ
MPPIAVPPAEPAALLKSRFGLADFNPGQREVIDALLNQGAALAVFPTGGGKSLCYQLPALLFEGVTVVISPLIALMKDQIDVLRGRGIAAARLDSSLSDEEFLDVNRQLRAGTLKLLYVAPERFNNERFLEQLGRIRIALFAVDEAHCISEWGHNFRPDYLKLADTARALAVERVLALTATATPAVVDDICASFDIPRDCAFVTGFHRPNLLLRTTPLRADERGAALIERLRRRPPGAGIVYVTLQKTAERVAAQLANAGLAARAYHAGMDDDERTSVQEWWKASDHATVVATIAFGMGIDKADVRYVYHYNLPKSLESYSQEIGRAGRDGAPAIVEILGSLEDVAALENFAYGDTPTDAALRSLLDEVLSAGATFDISTFELSNRHDIRPLVLRTALTYLELLGILKQGTPFYAGYRARPLLTLEEIAARFSGERAQFVQDIFAWAQKGRTWYALDPTQIAEALGQDRQRIVRALEYFGEQGWIELKVADARQRYTRLIERPNSDALAAELLERFARREAQEVARIGQVVALIAHAGCQTNMLLNYFGEYRTAPCGHCGFCKTQRASTFPEPVPPPAIDAALDASMFAALCDTTPAALGDPRQQARFLCGLSSPRLTQAKLSRHALFGVLEGRHFSDVLAWCRATLPTY